MNAKTYKAPTIQQALNQIKQELGPEAVILSTQSVMKRRLFGLMRRQNWEVTATGNTAAQPETANPARESDAIDGKTVLSESSPRIAPRLQFNDGRMEELLDEISDLKRSVRLIARSTPGGANAGGCYAELVGQGIEEQLADYLTTNASRGNPSPTEIRDRVRRDLSKMLMIDPP